MEKGRKPTAHMDWSACEPLSQRKTKIKRQFTNQKHSKTTQKLRENKNKITCNTIEQWICMFMTRQGGCGLANGRLVYHETVPVTPCAWSLTELYYDCLRAVGGGRVQVNWTASCDSAGCVSGC